MGVGVEVRSPRAVELESNDWALCNVGIREVRDDGDFGVVEGTLEESPGSSTTGGCSERGEMSSGAMIGALKLINGPNGRIIDEVGTEEEPLV